MERTKAAVSVKVKHVIEALCSLLAATGLEHVPAPETFRRAKFGGGLEVEDQFWQLLTSILQKACIVSPQTHAPDGAEHRKLVAAGLWQTGYYADWMCGREGGSFSSRDLLLALGWLLATATLDKLLRERVQQLDTTLLSPTPVTTQLSTELLSDSASLRKLQWLTGCLRHQGRTLMSVQEERTGLLHAVLCAPPLSSVSSSAHSSTVLKEDLVVRQQLCDLLEAYLYWKEVENVFWTWMDSVVDCHCHLTDPVVEKDTHSPSGSVRVCHHRNRGLERLEDILLRLPTEQKEKRNGGADAEDRGDRWERFPPHPSSLPSSLPSLSEVYRARLQNEKRVRHGSRSAEGPHGGAGAPDKLSLSQGVQLLLQTEALLSERRERQRLANRMQLQEIAGRLDHLVLIPQQTLLQ